MISILIDWEKFVKDFADRKAAYEEETAKLGSAFTARNKTKKWRARKKSKSNTAKREHET
jgi:hypothetical protein